MTSFVEDISTSCISVLSMISHIWANKRLTLFSRLPIGRSESCGDILSPSLIEHWAPFLLLLSRTGCYHTCLSEDRILFRFLRTNFTPDYLLNIPGIIMCDYFLQLFTENINLGFMLKVSASSLQIKNNISSSNIFRTFIIEAKYVLLHPGLFQGYQMFLTFFNLV